MWEVWQTISESGSTDDFPSSATRMGSRGLWNGSPGSSAQVFPTGSGGGPWQGREHSVRECQVLIFPAASKWQTEEPLSPSVCVFSASRRGKYDGEMMARYRQALETAVNISGKHNLPPLPGRTVLVYLTDAGTDELCRKSNLQGVKNK